ncbi:AI-2E family transporter [Candidatus Woesebacteria bacterium]|nr:AI-2E family transporter [Candidatus Woesebacteria bacterium]
METPFFKNRTINISQSSIIFAVALILGIFFVYQIRQILSLFFLAFILMVALNPVVKRFQRWGVKRMLSIAMAYSLLIVALSVFLAIVVPPLVYQLLNLFDFLKTIPWLADQLSIFNGDLNVLQAELTGVQLSINDVGSAIGALSTPFSVAFSIISAVFSNVFLVFSIFVMAYFLLIERPTLYAKLGWITKDKKRIARAKEYIDTLEEQLGGWVRGELILMFVIGLGTFVGLTLLGVPYALPLAILAGTLELIPNLGPTISAIPAMAIALAVNGPIGSLQVFIFAIFIQQVENNFLVPRIMKSSAQVGSLVVILVILIGAQLAGVMGALLAVPLYITLRSWYSFYLYPKLLE